MRKPECQIQSLFWRLIVIQALETLKVLFKHRSGKYQPLLSQTMEQMSVHCPPYGSANGHSDQS